MVTPMRIPCERLKKSHTHEYKVNSLSHTDFSLF